MLVFFLSLISSYFSSLFPLLWGTLSEYSHIRHLIWNGLLINLLPFILYHCILYSHCTILFTPWETDRDFHCIQIYIRSKKRIFIFCVDQYISSFLVFYLVRCDRPIFHCKICDSTNIQSDIVLSSAIVYVDNHDINRNE